MFSPHETDRKRRRRALFFALCVAPSLAVAAWTTAKLRPGRDARLARAIEATLLTPAGLVGASEPRPGVTRCESVLLYDGTSDEQLATLQTAIAQRQDGRNSLFIERLEIPANEIVRLALAAEGWLADESLSCEAIVSELILIAPQKRDGEGTDEQPEGHARGDAEARGDSARGASAGGDTWSIHDVRLRLDRSDSAARRIVLQGMAGDDEAPVRVTAERSVDAYALATVKVVVDATQASLPVWATAGIAWPLADWPEAQLHGRLTWEFRDGELVAGQFTGEAAPLEASRLIPSSSAHRCTGAATLTGAELKWCKHGPLSLSGSIELLRGSCSGSLAAAAVESLSCVMAEDLARSDAARTPPINLDAMFEIDRLACRFEFTEVGLTVTGLCGEVSPLHELSRGTLPPHPHHVVALHLGKPWLLDPCYTDVFAGSWVQFLYSRAGSYLPATREAMESARRLPLPKDSRATLRK